MKKTISLIFTFIFISIFFLSPAAKVLADNSSVIYNGNSKEFIFLKGSNYSPTDLFDNFKGVMPGDSLTQPITVRNEKSNKVKVKIYMRSLGAHENSKEFLSQLNLKVEKSADNKMAYMFDAAASEPAQLSDWVLLGTLYSGGEVNLNVILDVPKELDNKYQNEIGYLDWEFKIEELPIDSSDPKPTGDFAQSYLWWIISFSVCLLLLIVIYKRNLTKIISRRLQVCQPPKR